MAQARWESVVAGLLHDYGGGGWVQDEVPVTGVAEEIEKPRREPGLN